MKRIQWTVAARGSCVRPILHPQRNGCDRVQLTVAVLAHRDVVAVDFEEIGAGAQDFADEKFERSSCGLQFVTLTLHLLDAVGAVRRGRARRVVHRADGASVCK